jgi:protein-tyrosine-phosphatase
MAEGFANLYGKDVLRATSAGLAPVPSVVPETVFIMNERSVDISGHVPMPYNPLHVDRYDIVVNMSGYRLPGKPPKQLLEWKVRDPYQQPPDVYRKVRADIETRVMELILRLRGPKQ